MAAVGITLDEAIDLYLDQRTREKKTKASTLSNHRCLLRRFSKFMGYCRMSQIDPHDVWVFVYGEPGRTGLMEPHVGRGGKVHAGVAGQSANKYVDILSVFFGFCERRHLTRHDLLSELRLTNGQVSRMDETVTDMVHLSIEQMFDMVDAARWPRDRILLAVACQTGCRISELKRMRLGDLRLDLNEIRVWRTKVKGKDREPDDMPIFPELYVELWPWLEHYAALMTTYRRLDIPLNAGTMLEQHPNWFLLPSQRVIPVYGKPGQRRLVSYVPDMPASNPERPLRQALSAIGVELPEGQAMHALRRSVADVIDDAFGIEMAQAMLGHKDAETTRRYLRRNKLQEQRNKVLAGGFMHRPEPAGTISLADKRRGATGG